VRPPFSRIPGRKKAGDLFSDFLLALPLVGGRYLVFDELSV